MSTPAKVFMGLLVMALLVGIYWGIKRIRRDQTKLEKLSSSGKSKNRIALTTMAQDQNPSVGAPTRGAEDQIKSYYDPDLWRAPPDVEAGPKSVGEIAPIGGKDYLDGEATTPRQCGVDQQESSSSSFEANSDSAHVVASTVTDGALIGAALGHTQAVNRGDVRGEFDSAKVLNPELVSATVYAFV